MSLSDPWPGGYWTQSFRRLSGAAGLCRRFPGRLSLSLSLSLSLWAPGSVASGLRGGIRGIALYLLKKESKTDRKGNELRNFERSDSAILSTILKAYALPFQKDLR